MKSWFVAVVGAAGLVAVALASDAKEQFRQYKRDFQKEYASEAEEAERFEVFQRTLERVERLNALSPASPPVFGLTFTSDRFEHEKPSRGRRGHGDTRFISRKDLVEDVSGYEVPKVVDWRLSRAVTPVKNQGQCGSCWAFSTAETVESAYYLSKIGADVPQEFSAQQIASCVESMDGCGGGDTVTALEYLSRRLLGSPPCILGLRPRADPAQPVRAKELHRKMQQPQSHHSFQVQLLHGPRRPRLWLSLCHEAVHGRMQEPKPPGARCIPGEQGPCEHLR